MRHPVTRTTQPLLLGLLIVSLLLAGCGEATPPQNQIPASPQPAGPGEPRIYDFKACSDPCNSSLGNQLTFPPDIRSINISWKYENIAKGAHYVRTWQHATRGVWKTYDCLWNGPAAGQVDIRFFDLAGGLAAGVWTLTMTVDDKVLLQQQLTIEGGNGHWAPQDPIHACF